GARLTAAVGSGVYQPEGRRSRGEEGGWVGGDGVGDAFAAAQAGGDEVVGVPPVDLGAGGANGLAAGAAGLVEDGVGQGRGVEGLDDLPGAGVDRRAVAAELDRSGAAAG